METTLTQSGLFNYALIYAEAFPILSIIQLDEQFFSQREQDVLHHLLRGKTTTEIANALSISATAIIHHINTIKIKMKLTSNSTFVENLTAQFAKIGWLRSQAKLTTQTS